MFYPKNGEGTMSSVTNSSQLYRSTIVRDYYWEIPMCIRYIGYHQMLMKAF